RLNTDDASVVSFNVFKRSYDARKKSGGVLLFVYVVDVEVVDETGELQAFAADKNIRVSPDTNYYPVATAPKDLNERPLIIGFGPCGLFAALTLAQMGFNPIVLERGRDVR